MPVSQTTFEDIFRAWDLELAAEAAASKNQTTTEGEDIAANEDNLLGNWDLMDIQ